MRNLKRTLSLVLAALMLMGMMVVGAGAASKDFTDASEIKNVEAVDVMVALGILEGGDKGDFQPNSILTREQAAKIICYMLLGEESAEKLSTNSAVFNDVAADRWSAPYIGYCVNMGILAGDGNGNFFPEGKLTGAAFAKMLLVALGYDATIEKYVGNDWMINVASDAIEAGISPSGVVLSDNLSRQNAAQMAFQTLTATVVKYDNKGTTVIGSDGMQVIVGASSASPVSNTTSNYDKTGDGKGDSVMQFCEKYFSDLTKEKGDADAFGRPADYQWKLDGDEVYNATLSADQTYTTATKGSDIYKDLGKPSGATYTYYVDGKDVTDTITTYYTGFAIASGDSDKIGGKGSVVEVFETADDEYTVTVTNTFVGQISDWTEANEDKDVKESVDVAALTQPADVTGASGTLNANYETVAFDESDADDETVVLFTAAWDTDTSKYVIQSMSVAESVTGFVSSTTGTTKFVLDGTTYEYGTLKEGTATYVKDGDDTVIYLDSYGYVVYVTDVPASTENYAYVLAAEAGTFGEGGLAKLVLSTGEVVVVDTEDPYTALKNDIVSYTVDDDSVYTLTKVADETDAGALSITKGKTAITLPGSTGVTNANSNTVFVVETEAGKTYETYTGYANVPSLEGDSVKVAVAANETSSKLADVIFIFNADETGTNADEMTYLAMASKGGLVKDADGEYYVVNAIVDGEITTLKLDKALFADGGALNGVSGDVVLKSFSTNSKDVVTGVNKAVDGTDYESGTKTVKAADGLLGIGTDLFGYTDKTVVYKIDADGEITTSTVSSIRDDANDTVIFTQDSDNDTLVNVYVTEVD